LTTSILITTDVDSLQNGRVGDFLIIGAAGADIYVCPKEHFLSTYAKHRSGEHRYIKSVIVLAQQLKNRLKLANENGWSTGNRGDYCVSSSDRTSKWIVSKKQFEENYVEVRGSPEGFPRWI